MSSVTPTSLPAAAVHRAQIVEAGTFPAELDCHLVTLADLFMSSVQPSKSDLVVEKET